MPVSKLKNLAILILLLANLALLALLIPSRIAAREQTDSLANALSELCESRDVSLSPDAVPDTMTLYALGWVRIPPPISAPPPPFWARRFWRRTIPPAT